MKQDSIMQKEITFRAGDVSWHLITHCASLKNWRKMSQGPKQPHDHGKAYEKKNMHFQCYLASTQGLKKVFPKTQQNWLN